MTKTWCVGERQYSNTNNTTQNEEKPKKLVRIIKVKCDICSRSKSQIFTK